MTNVHQCYRASLTYWRRRLFDPFRRRQRIVVVIDGEEHETTLGQANFALWAYTSGVLAFVLGHLESIEADMNRVAQQQKRCRKEAAKKGIARKRRAELTKASQNTCLAFCSPLRVNFD